jgi:hypothetical protein
MPISETWLLPDGVADVLPEQAQVVEALRRQALDFPQFSVINWCTRHLLNTSNRYLLFQNRIKI